MDNGIIVYTKNVCKYCQIVKNYLDDRGLAYEVRNIEENEQYKAEHEALGYQAVPVTLIDGKPVVGFDLRKLNELLG